MICRLCLNNLTEDNALPLYCNKAETEFVKIITKYLLLELTCLDSISTNICPDCATHLNSFHEFCKFVDERQSTLRNEFLEVKCAFDVQEHLAMERLIDDNDESLLDIKDIINQWDTQICDVTQHQDEFSNAKAISAAEMENDVSLKNLYESAEGATGRAKLKRKKRKSVLSTKQSKRKLKILRPKTKVNKAINSNNSSDNELLKEDIKSKSENDDVKSDEFIAKYLKLKCDLCAASMETFGQLWTHFKNVHNCAGYAKCCGRHFQKRIELVDHIHIHLNPQYFQCKICHKNLISKYSLIKHTRNRHTNKEDWKYCCSVCGKKFSSNNYLKQHNLAHQTEKNFYCKHCEKAFVSQYRLKAHIQAIHVNIIAYVCDICGREFKFKPSFDQHVFEHQGIIKEPPVQCNICGNWFKHKYGLSKHLKKHNEVKVDCKICGRVCPTNAALQSHIRNIHNKPCNLKCNFCDKAFKMKRSLEEHIAIHTGEKHNLCPHCPKEFRSKANMYVHIKKEHFEEWSKKRSKLPALSSE